MQNQGVDISTFIWLDPKSAMYPTRHHVSLEHYRDYVIQPALRSLDAHIDELDKSDDPGSVFLREDLAELFQGAVGTFLLSIQAMWERGLRSQLIARANELGEILDLRKKLQRAPWSDNKSGSLQEHFENLMGVPLQAFDSYEDLDLLQAFGNAVRHGDGDAAKKIHQRCPNLWWGWFAPGEDVIAGPFKYTIPENALKHPSFENITLKEEVLTQMIKSVLWFWEDLELMRCNSFRNKHHSTQKQLDEWEANRQARAGQRSWSPSDSLFTPS